MKNRLVIVTNSRSSGYKMVYDKILCYIDALTLDKNHQISYEIQPTNPLANAKKMAKVLKDDDVILVAGGDGTAHIATNAAFLSEKKNLKIKYTGFGNFNDYASSFSKNSHKACLEALHRQKIIAKLRPMTIFINDKFFRHVPLYATVGLTAEMAGIFEHKKVRGALKKVKHRNSRLILSLSLATRFYFKNRASKRFKNLKITQKPRRKNTQPQHISDFVFMNGPRMARIMRSKINKKTQNTFGFSALDSTKIIKNIPFLAKGMLGFTPLERQKNVKIDFDSAQDINIQIEGEQELIEKVKTIEVRKAKFEIGIL